MVPSALIFDVEAMISCLPEIDQKNIDALSLFFDSSLAISIEIKSFIWASWFRFIRFIISQLASINTFLAGRVPQKNGSA